MGFFDQFDSAPSRASDPETSKEAAKAVDLKGDSAYALDAVIRFPDSTSAEMESRLGCKDGKIRKRLKALCRSGLICVSGVRKCEVKGSKCQTYELELFDGTEFDFTDTL